MCLSPRGSSVETFSGQPRVGNSIGLGSPSSEADIIRIFWCKWGLMCHLVIFRFRKILNLELANLVKQTTKRERASLTEESTYWQTRGREEVFTHSSNFPVAFSSAVLSHLMQARNFGVRVRTQFWHPWRLFHLWRGAATWPERERNKRNTRNGCSGRAATGAGCITSWTRCNGRLSGKDLAFLFDQKSIASMCTRQFSEDPLVIGKFIRFMIWVQICCIIFVLQNGE